MDQNKPTRILFVCNSTASRLWRILPVAGYLESRNYIVNVIDTKDGFDSNVMDQYDVFVLQMVFDERLIDLIKKKKKKYVFEMDDLITWVPEDHYAKKEIKRSGWEWKRGCYKAIRRADLVTCTNEYLAKYYSFLRLGKSPIQILPNYMYKPFWIKPHVPRVSQDIRIGYVGGSSHKDDLKILINPLKKILTEYNNVTFITMGTGGYSADDEGFVEYNHGEDLFKELPRGKRQHYLGAKMMLYPDKLRTLEIDIGLAPLVENKFTKSKTPIKWMEYASIKAPAICQDFLYKSVIQNGVNGFLAKTEEDYYKYLKLLIDDKVLRNQIGLQAYQDLTTKHLFEQHAYQWLEKYRKFLKI